MGLGYLPPPGGGDFTPPPAGTHLATCYRVIDLGTQLVEWQGQTKHQHKVMVSWELHSDEVMEDGRPFVVSQRYTYSTHEKSKFRQDLESWRGAPFTDADFGGPPRGFHVKKLIGVPCLLNIIHETKNGKTFANIASISRIMKGQVPPALVNAKVYLSLDVGEFDQAAFDALSESVKGTIMKSPEWATLVSGKRDDEPMPLEAGDPGPVEDTGTPFDAAGGNVAPPATTPRTPTQWRAERDRMKDALKIAPTANAVNDLLTKWSNDDSLSRLRQFNEDWYEDVYYYASEREHALANIAMERARLTG